MTMPIPDQSTTSVSVVTNAATVTNIPIDPQQRYLLVLQTPTRISAEEQSHIATRVYEWWKSDEPFLLINLLPDEHVRLEWIKT